jgi:hypothetical protein
LKPDHLVPNLEKNKKTNGKKYQFTFEIEYIFFLGFNIQNRLKIKSSDISTKSALNSEFSFFDTTQGSFKFHIIVLIFLTLLAASFFIVTELILDSSALCNDFSFLDLVLNPPFLSNQLSFFSVNNSLNTILINLLQGTKDF